MRQFIVAHALCALFLQQIALCQMPQQPELPAGCVWQQSTEGLALALANSTGNNCSLAYSGSPSTAISGTMREPASWLPPEFQVPGLTRIMGVTVAYSSCEWLWQLAVDVCTFRSSSLWPSPGLQVRACVCVCVTVDRDTCAHQPASYLLTSSLSAHLPPTSHLPRPHVPRAAARAHRLALASFTSARSLAACRPRSAST